jgi:hypothetical protein
MQGAFILGSESVKETPRGEKAALSVSNARAGGVKEI